jgi:ribose 5-phosphate isomerase A
VSARPAPAAIPGAVGTHGGRALSDTARVHDAAHAQKRAAAERAATLVEDGMRVGLGTGTTVAPLLDVLGARGLTLRCVATSPATQSAALAAGLDVVPFEELPELDIAIDGADQIGPGPWLVKGGGRAHTREKIVAAAAARFVVIGSAEKRVDAIRAPVPVELLAFGAPATLARLEHLKLRGGPASPDGGVIADWVGPVEDPAELALRLDAEPGIVAHGLFAPELVTDVIVARADGVEHERVA